MAAIRSPNQTRRLCLFLISFPCDVWGVANALLGRLPQAIILLWIGLVFGFAVEFTYADAEWLGRRQNRHVYLSLLFAIGLVTLLMWRVGAW